MKVHTPEWFASIKTELTVKAAEAAEKKLKEMGEDIKGISWFSSDAKNYPKNKV